jgi:glycosyltransferase involved in cell wall biosynthesis
MSFCASLPHERWQRGAHQLRAVHVIAGLEASHGGPSYCVPRLCEALMAGGAEATLLSVAHAGPTQSNLSGKGYGDLRFVWDYVHTPFLRNLRISSAFSVKLRHLAIVADVIHNHGLWLMPNIQAGRAATHAQKPLVVSPHGMLSPAALAFSGLKKRAFWKLLQGPVVRQAACIHATSAAEYEEIRGFGLTNPVSIIPNGIDLPEELAKPSRKVDAHRVVLSLGRIHPKKGLDGLIRAWAAIEVARPDWRLRIVGPSEAGHSDELQALAISLGLARVSIEGAAYGEAKQAAYRDADLFVLPTMNENFGLSVGEALAAGMPAISTKGAPWSGLEAEGCGWWIAHGVEPLAAALANATAMPSEVLSAMGAKGRAWMDRDFSWDRVACDMICTYRWLKGGSDKPSTIQID